MQVMYRHDVYSRSDKNLISMNLVKHLGNRRVNSPSNYYYCIIPFTRVGGGGGGGGGAEGAQVTADSQQTRSVKLYIPRLRLPGMTAL